MLYISISVTVIVIEKLLKFLVFKKNVFVLSIILNEQVYYCFCLIFSCRFLLGGDHGRLKYIPPDDFSPLVESLLPQQILSLEPCFYFGNLNKCVIAGPLLVEDDTAFVPAPVDTSMVISKNRQFVFWTHLILIYFVFIV